MSYRIRFSACAARKWRIERSSWSSPGWLSTQPEQSASSTVSASSKEVCQWPSAGHKLDPIAVLVMLGEPLGPFCATPGMNRIRGCFIRSTIGGGDRPCLQDRTVPDVPNFFKARVKEATRRCGMSSVHRDQAEENRRLLARRGSPMRHKWRPSLNCRRLASSTSVQAYCGDHENEAREQ